MMLCGQENGELMRRAPLLGAMRMFANSASSLGLSAPVRHPARFIGIVSAVAKFVAGGLETRRQLRALADLNDDLLRVIGLSREDVDHACSTPFWMRHLGASG